MMLCVNSGADQPAVLAIGGAILGTRTSRPYLSGSRTVRVPEIVHAVMSGFPPKATHNSVHHYWHTNFST